MAVTGVLELPDLPAHLAVGRDLGGAVDLLGDRLDLLPERHLVRVEEREVGRPVGDEGDDRPGEVGAARPAAAPDVGLDDVDLAGTIVGVVEEDAALHGDGIRPGDLLLGYASTGLHTNGYTLARRIVFERMGLALDDRLGDTGSTVADALLAIHRSYYRSVRPVLDRVHGLAHITGGGIPGNLVRVLPAGCEAVVDPGSWELPPLFAALQQAGRIGTDEMRDVFNLGVGLIAVLPPDGVAAARAAAAADGVATWVMGEIGSGEPAVRFTGG